MHIAPKRRRFFFRLNWTQEHISVPAEKGKTMARTDLITKDFALYVVHYFASMLTWSKQDILGEIDRTIKEADRVDAVRVIRCKDCKHMEVTPDCLRWCHVWSGINGMGDDGFCNYGERRSDG